MSWASSGHGGSGVPQPGHAITIGMNERSPMVWIISCADNHLARAVAAGLGA